MAFTPKAWQNDPAETTPVSAAGLIDLETRLGAYADTVTGSSLLGSVETTSSYTTTTTAVEDITSMSLTVTIGTRPVYIALTGNSFTKTTNAGTYVIDIYDVTAGAAIRAGGAVVAAGTYSFPNMWRVVTPAAGSRTYKARIFTSTATATAVASATSPLQLVVLEV